MNAGPGSFVGPCGHATGAGGVLVVGLSHSGKTEVRSLLETSPRMFGARRSRYWAESGERWGTLDVQQNLDSCIDALEREVVEAGWLTDVRKDVAGCLATSDVRTYPGLLACLHRTEARRRGKDMWCVQVGGVERLLPHLLASLTELKVVHTVRDPRDRLVISRSSPLPGRRGWDLGRWEQSLRVGLECHRRFPDRYMLVRWEDLLSRSQAISTDLEEFVGCRIVPASVARPSTEKLSPRGGIDGPHTVAAVRDSMTAIGYEAARRTGVSLPDLVELATLTLFRRAGDRTIADRNDNRESVVPR